MFSPSVSQPAQIPSGSVRSSRRRARPLSNEGSIVQPKAKRQRSALSGETFIPPIANGNTEMEEVKSLQVAQLPQRQGSRDYSGTVRTIAHRGKGKKASKDDGSSILVS